MSCDPNFDNVVLLLPFDGTNGQTTTTDLSRFANTMTFAGDATLTTASPAFGTASLNCPDTTTTAGHQLVTTPVVAGGPLDILSGAADFTIEGFFWINAGFSPAQLCILDYGNDQSGGGFNANAAGLVLQAGASNYSVTTAVNSGAWGGISNAVSISTGAWHHFAIVRTSGTGTLYLDGNAQAGAPVWSGFTLSGSYHGFVNIGGSQTFNGAVCPGKVDEIRVTSGLARYTSNFTPPAAPFSSMQCSSPCDSDFASDALLLHVDGTNGQLTTVDSSSYANPVLMNATLCALTTTNPLFGTASLAVNGANNFSTYALAVPFTSGSPLDVFQTTEYTIECAFCVTSYNSGATSILFDYGGDLVGGVRSELIFQVATSSDGSTGTVGITDYSAFGTTASIGSSTIAMGFNVWHRMAFVRHAGVNTLYVDGIAVQTNTSWNPGTYTNNGAGVNVGCWGRHSGGNAPCQIDEVRVSNIARYTGNYTPAAYAFGGSCSITVPDVTGEPLATAEANIVAADLTVGTVTTANSGSVPTGDVISQSPVGGSIAASGDPIALVESLGPVTVLVPNVVNTSLLVVAPAVLAAASFVAGAVTYEASGVIIAGNVVRQSPAAGSFAVVGSAVNLAVSTGLPSLRVPDLFGLSQSGAILALTTLGLVVGAIGSAPSMIVPPNTVQTQNPSAGTPVAAGSIVSFVMSTGIPAVGTMFDFEATVISQYANSPIILQLVNNLNQYIDQSANFANFFNFVWNVDTAVGFGLNIWGKIVGVSRLLHIPNTTDYVGFDNGTRSPPDWQSMGSDQPPGPPVGGAMYTGYNATTAYLLGDDAYRQLIFAKAFANIAATTAPAINQILQNLYGPGTAFVLNDGPMAISYNLTFTPSAIQLAILEQSGVIPTPPGVSVTINTNV